MATPKAKRKREHRRYIRVKDLPIHWNENRETRPEQDAKFQAKMKRVGYEQHTSTELGTDIPRLANVYSEGSASSPQGWEV